MKRLSIIGSSTGLVAAALIAALGRDVFEDHPVAKPQRKQVPKGPVVDTTKETKREKRRRLRGV